MYSHVQSHIVRILVGFFYISRCGMAMEHLLSAIDHAHCILLDYAIICHWYFAHFAFLIAPVGSHWYCTIVPQRTHFVMLAK